MQETRLGLRSMEEKFSNTRVYLPKAKKRGEVISYEKLTLEEEAGIIRLYNALVPEPISEKIDVKLIYEEGFPAFEKTIGKDAFSKVKKYFGIGRGMKAKMPKVPDRKIMALVGQLRTVENATKYISGYKELIEKVAKKLVWAPEEMKNLEKAKLIRAYIIIFFEYHFFVEDFSYIQQGNEQPEKVINKQLFQANNKKAIYPEELFFLNDMCIRYYQKGIMYGTIAEEIKLLDKRLRKEVLEFAELSLLPDGRFTSTNLPAKSYTFGSVRKLKMQANPVRGYYPIDAFFDKGLIEAWDFGAMYKLYRSVKTHLLEEYPKVKFPVVECQGACLFEGEIEIFKISAEEMFSSEQECKRFIRYVEYLISQDCILDVQYVLENGEIENRPLSVADFMGAVKFAKISEYLTEDSVQQDFDVANILLTRAGESSIWSEYQKDEISFEEVKETLKIDATFEKEVLHFKKKETPEETARRFAEECGFPDYDMELLTNVLLSGNEVLFEKYSAEEIDIQKLKKQLGYDDDFADMYFQLKAVDISAIEQRLLEIKKSFSGKSATIQKNRLLVNLYCYLVEGQIPCGIKMKAPKRNKALKPKNLRALI